MQRIGRAENGDLIVQMAPEEATHVVSLCQALIAGYMALETRPQEVRPQEVAKPKKQRTRAQRKRTPELAEPPAKNKGGRRQHNGTTAAVVAILRDAGKPLRNSEIYERFLKRTGKEPGRALKRRLGIVVAQYKQLFRRVDVGTYELAPEASVPAKSRVERLKDLDPGPKTPPVEEE